MVHIVNNKTGDSLCELPAQWSKPKLGYRYSDCQGDIAWLSDCSADLETGPIYFAPCDKNIAIIQWSTNPGVVNGSSTDVDIHPELNKIRLTDQVNYRTT